MRRKHWWTCWPAARSPSLRWTSSPDRTQSWRACWTSIWAIMRPTLPSEFPQHRYCVYVIVCMNVHTILYLAFVCVWVLCDVYCWRLLLVCPCRWWRCGMWVQQAQWAAQQAHAPPAAPCWAAQAVCLLPAVARAWACWAAALVVWAPSLWRVPRSAVQAAFPRNPSRECIKPSNRARFYLYILWLHYILIGICVKKHPMVIIMGFID